MVALVASLLATPLCRRIAVRTGFVAHPSARGVHREPTPLLGGVAIVLAFLVGSGIGARFLDLFLPLRILGFLVGGLLVFAMGVVDDRVNLSWSSKLVGQVVAAVVLLASGNTGDLPFFSAVGLLLSVLWVVGLTNAFNFLDNMDGITPGITVLASLTFGAIALLCGQVEAALIAAALAGASLGFLRSNFPPARIFLGDGGSLFLGYTLAALGLMVTHREGGGSLILVPVLVLSYPIFDITFVSVTRYARGQSLTQGGRDHTSHRLTRITGATRTMLLVIYGLCLLVGAVAVCLSYLSYAPATIVTFVAAVFGFVALGNYLCRRAPVPKSGAPSGPVSWRTDSPSPPVS